MWTGLFLGEYLLIHGDLHEAEKQLVSSFSLADRSGDLMARAGCLSLLAMVALRCHDTKWGPFHGSPGRGCK